MSLRYKTVQASKNASNKLCWKEQKHVGQGLCILFLLEKTYKNHVNDYTADYSSELLLYRNMNFHRAALLSICVRINWEGSDDGIRIFQHVVSGVIIVSVYPVLVVKNWACRFTWRITLRYADNEKCASQSEHFWGCKFLADIYIYLGLCCYTLRNKGV